MIEITDSYDAGLDNLLASGQKIDMGCAHYYPGGNAYNRICYDLTDFVENDPSIRSSTATCVPSATMTASIA